MKPSTWAYAAGLAASATALVVSVRSVRSGAEYTFACWGAAEETAELREKVIDPVNRRTGGRRVRPIPIPSDYPTKLTTMIAGGAPPDFFYLSQEYVPAFAARGVLADLTDRVAADADPVTDLSGYYGRILERFRYRGRLYGLPWIAQPVILYCNVRLFRAAGVALPDGTWRWEQFVSAARALTRDADGDGRIDQWGFILRPGWPPLHMWVWQNGSEIIDSRTGRLNADDPRVLEALDFVAGLIHRQRVAPPLEEVSERGFAEWFRAGKVAMFMGGAADDLDRLPDLPVVAAEVPAGPGGIRATFAWSAGLFMSPSADSPEAFEAYKRLLESIQRWKVPAPRRALAGRLAEFEPRKARSAEVIRRSMEYMRTPPVLDNQLRWDTRFREEFEEPLLRTGAPAREILRRARARLEELL